MIKLKLKDEMKEKLLAAGYGAFKPNRILDQFATAGYQKRIRDEKGTKYFITFYEYDHSRYGTGISGLSYEVKLQAEKRFKGREYNFNTTIFSFNDWNPEERKREYSVTIEEIESLIEEYWKKNKFKYYEKY